ncbi:helix-turn-helix transcriptional regulator [Pontibacter beigongshangensis]|uniref:helix-turn-helix transcriptional regulator n=1 Tax=Pontibacter beigongshangensis TaxID=2574733 RepID=UPI00164F53D8|nr:AraC family transcriptional regulator [Pontibacter beigongshangensis]
MTHKGKSVTPEGEFSAVAAPEATAQHTIWHFRNLFRVSADSSLRFTHAVGETGRVYEYFSKGAYFRHTSGCFLPSTRLVLEHEAPFVHMAFSLHNNRSYTLSASGKPIIQLRQHQHNLYLLPSQRVEVEWPQEAAAEFFDIFISTDSFFRYLPASHPLYMSFQHAVAQNKFGQLSSSNLPLTPRIIALLYEILNCQFSGHCKCIFAEAKVVELLALQLDQQGQSVAPAAPEGLKDEDVEKMQQAKAIVLANLEAPLTLKDLAHQVGTNEYNLKKHFKEIFGTTVYGYLHQHKMEQSRELLLQGESKIAEVARLMGYKHATHFTSAFKKHFGFPPNKLKVS